MKIVTPIVCALAFVGPMLAVHAAPTTPLRVFEPRATASAWWTAQTGEDEARSTAGGAVLFPCDMGRLAERAYWDRAIRLDLSHANRISFRARVTGDLAAISSCTLYLHSGDGWYDAGFGLSASCNVMLDLATFRPEGSPAGWSKIDAVRISFWKAQPRQVTVQLSDMRSETSDVAVVRCTSAGTEASEYAERTSALFQSAGLSCGTVDDTDVADGALESARVAIFPLNPTITDAQADAIDAFVHAGGRILVCYNVPRRLADLLGVRETGFLPSTRANQFAVMRFAAGAVSGLPTSVRQASWNVTRVEPVGRNAQVIGIWQDPEGRPSGAPAVVLSETGAYISHVLLDDDRAGKERMLRALVGKLRPDLWPDMARQALEGATAISPSTRGLAPIRAAVGSAPARQRGTALGLLARGETALAKARKLMAAGRSSDSVEASAAARAAFTGAYARAQVPRGGEMRALWCHSAYGVAGMTWAQTIAAVKSAGFNAVIPNMLWGGVADYPSEVLPASDRVARDGDAIAQCISAAHHAGIEVHVWKVNWNLARAPESLVARLRAEGRVQRSASGAETLWLCPSHPANQALELAAMTEVVRKYDVDGIHFDYIRYLDGDNCYCDGCRKRFEEEIGHAVGNWPADVRTPGVLRDRYLAFRRANITRLVRAVSTQVHLLKPWVKVSAAVFNSWPSCRDEIGQDWVQWAKDGLLDFVCPMNYTASDTQLGTMVQVERDALNGCVPLYSGIGASAPGLPVTQVIDQVRIARQSGADGFVVFNLDPAVTHDYLPAMGSGITASNALAPHNAPSIVWGTSGSSVTAKMVANRRQRKAPSVIRASVWVCRVDGTPIQRAGTIRVNGPMVRLPHAPAGSRTEVRGTLTIGGKAMSFTVRGPLLGTVVSR